MPSHQVHRDCGMYGGIKLLAGSAAPDLAAGIAKYLGQPLSGCDVVQFPNQNLFVRLKKSVRGQDVPRGDGVCTRRPLELRLNHASENIEPWAKFDEVPNKKFTDFAEVKQTIDFLTDKVCGKSKNIIDKPIVLTVYSHTCPDLTLIDLPGITRIPMAGSDQPDNIE